MTRRFVAIGIPHAVREPLAEVTAHLRGPDPRLRPTDPAGWHVTLAFLGAVADDVVGQAFAAIGEAVTASAPRPAPRLELAGAGRFADRVLLARVGQDPSGALEPLVTDLHMRLREAGLPMEDRAFRPHVTLARARRRAPVEAGDLAALELPALTWQPETIDVWRSTAAPGVYDVEVALAWPSVD